jgi:hypothetical protein
MAGIVRHRQTKGSATDRPRLNNRATSRLHQVGPGTQVTGLGGGLNGSTQHSLEVCLQESYKLKSFASVESIGTLPCLVLIEYSRTDRFSRGSIVGSTD